MNKGEKQPFRKRNKCRLVLDSRAFVNIFYNGDLIEDIQFLVYPTQVMTCRCIPIKYNKVGRLSSLLRQLPIPVEDYYYYENAMANLLSLGKITKKFRAVFDLGIDNVFTYSMMMVPTLFSLKSGIIYIA